MRRVVPPALLLLLAACAPTSRAPSLAPRPIESLDRDEPAAATPAAPTGAAPADPALTRRYAAIVAAAHDGDAAFQRDERAARAAVARATRAAIGSEAWVSAQQEVTALETTRGPVTQALVALDDERTSGTFDEAGLDAAVAEVVAIDTRQRAALAELTRMLPAP